MKYIILIIGIDQIDYNNHKHIINRETNETYFVKTIENVYALITMYRVDMMS